MQKGKNMGLNFNIRNFSNEAQINSGLKRAQDALTMQQNNQAKDAKAEVLKSISQLKNQGVFNFINSIDSEPEYDIDDVDVDVDDTSQKAGDTETSQSTQAMNTVNTSSTVKNSGIKKLNIDFQKRLEDALANGGAHLLTKDEMLLIPIEENKDKTLAELISERKISEANKWRFITFFEHYDESFKAKIAQYEQTGNSAAIERLLEEMFEKYKDITLGDLTEKYQLGTQYIFTDGMTLREELERYGLD